MKDFVDNRQEAAIVVFKEKEIRRLWHKEEWWFAIVDVVQILTGSVDPAGYIKDMRRRDPQLAEGWGQIATPLSLDTKGGRQQINCANTEGIFRIIQSIPSAKSEPFKRWLAKVGYERIQEIENPELAQERMKQLYEQKGYSKDWIDKRLRGIAIRQNLTEEWQDRGINTSRDYAILTAEISKQEKPEGMPENKTVAHRGGAVAGNARQDAERELGKSIVSKENYLMPPEPRKIK